MPSVAVATPIPIAGQATPRIAASAPQLPPVPRVTPRPATPPMQITMIGRVTPIPAISATPMIAPSITPVPASATPLPRVAPSGVPPQPFLQAQRDPTVSSNGATWRTYAPGQAPAGRSVTPDEIATIASHGETGEGLYLHGEFRVTASGESKAVLRDANKSDADSARIVVEYPAGAVPPPEKGHLSRDPSRPFVFQGIRRDADGSVTVYVRDIMKQ